MSSTPARMSPQYQVYSLPDTNPGNQEFTISDGFVPAAQSTLSGNNQNFNLTAWMVGESDPGHYGQLTLYKVPQGTLGPANADAEISANQQVSSDITLLNQHGSQVLLGETLMVPIADSMVYLRPLYVAASTNPQPQLAYVVAVLGRTVKIDSSVSQVLTDIFKAPVVVPTGGGVSGAGAVPSAVAAILQAAQNDYTAAIGALQQNPPNYALYGQEIQAMDQQLTAAQQILQATAPSSTTTTTTTTTLPPALKGKKSSGSGAGSTTTTSTSSRSSTSSTSASSTTSTSIAPTSTEPRGGATTTSTTLASAAPEG